MKKHNDLMVDIEIAITKVMPWKMNTTSVITPKEYIKLAMVEVRKLVIPVLKGYDKDAAQHSRDIFCNEETIEELEGRVHELESNEEEREQEDEQKELLNLFYHNQLVGKES